MKAFKKNSLQKEMHLKLEKKINSLKCTLDSLKKEHISLVCECYNVSDTLVDMVAKVKCVACSYLKLEIETIKG